MLSHWNHRFSTYRDATQAQVNVGSLPRLPLEQLDDPDVEPLTRYWIEDRKVRSAIPSGWNRDWFIGWRDIARASDARTFVPSVMPASAVGNRFPLAFSANALTLPLLQSIWSSMIFDYLARQKLPGTGMTYFIVKQLACPRPSSFEAIPPWSDDKLSVFVHSRVLELTYTSHRIKPYAVDVAGGEPSAPFRWIPDRRARLIAELDAAMLHSYELERDDAEHVLDSFPVVRKYDERDFGEFRTKRLVLTEYDAMSRASETGIPYRSALSPPPGAGPRHEKAPE